MLKLNENSACLLVRDLIIAIANRLVFGLPTERSGYCAIRFANSAVSHGRTNLSASVELEAASRGEVPEFIELPHRSPGARTQGRACGERPGARAEARAERRRNVAEKIAATGTAAVIGIGSGDIGAEPVTAGFALRIDALHRKAGQILHFLSILGAGPDASAARRQLERALRSPGRPNPWW